MKNIFIKFICLLMAFLQIITLNVWGTECDIEKKVQYRFKEKIYVTSKEELDAPWILYNTELVEEHTDYHTALVHTGEAERWEYDNKERFCIHSKTKMYRYDYTSSSGTAYRYKDYLSTSRKIVENGTTFSYSGNTYFYYEFCMNRTVYNLYSYYSWSDWSAWCDTVYTESDSVKVENRNVYKQTVIYQLNGGTGKDKDFVFQYEKLPIPEIPVKTNSVFVGWYKDEALTEAWDFENDVINEDITLYAKWGQETSAISVTHSIDTNNTITLDILISNIANDNSTIYIALYDDNDVLLQTNRYSAEEMVIVTLDSTDGAYIKVMLWDDNLTPLAESVKVEL